MALTASAWTPWMRARPASWRVHQHCHHSQVGGLNDHPKAANISQRVLPLLQLLVWAGYIGACLSSMASCDVCIRDRKAHTMYCMQQRRGTARGQRRRLQWRAEAATAVQPSSQLRLCGSVSRWRQSRCWGSLARRHSLTGALSLRLHSCSTTSCPCEARSSSGSAPRSSSSRLWLQQQPCDSESSM